ncbi:TIGR01458 family HAD-type hydrolase [Sediminicurvatus halobius]|uniref:Haloacid dehalogenase-like hydrolase domain-containing protein 2 n=1 Tax=Sediminicurvatus halobius TaxID=2182432 RepID=A0A2U2MXF6_9GAMM|nr:TIGR01458 family HAD-type hydrolase [Spiribacter halobius]PWG61558.1 TIGR01458 family HAD-type hydrolase [Spiribacter halobius]UEX77127.1 TIGR01458 family HAD-type hydrolase [Spiribacter halobius]
MALDDPPRGLLIDIDGVLYVGDAALPGAGEALQRLRAAGLPLRFVTNTTRRSADDLLGKLRGLGFEVAPEELLTAPRAAAHWLRARGSPRILPLIPEVLEDEFSEFPVDEVTPEVVLLGDLGDAWRYQHLNQAFRALMDGAELLALHRSRYWRTETGLQLDLGGFVAALEYASGCEAVIAGKPAAAFFAAALDGLGVAASEALMVGDDLEADVGGAQAAGIPGALVRTGKFRETQLARSEVRPAAVIDSIAELPALLGMR